MSHPMIVNIINFIRAVEPRCEMDLVEPVARQIELVREFDFPATWLLQYDALISGPYVEMLREFCAERSDQEVGGWFELVQPQVEKAGLVWRGRFPWDWHSHVGFSVGYAPEERERLVDVYMEAFEAAFGRHPATVGSWFMDAHTLAYLHDRYGVIGSCNCKDQYGTDGYTLWGGYWNQAYYPSRRNALMPAQTSAGQIGMPVFRMLGSDPIDQYDVGLYDGDNCTEVKAQRVVSLEPVYTGHGGGGGCPEWVRWFFHALQENPSLAFQYTQVGQENSFGWKAMRDGLTDQFRYLQQLREENDVLRIETLETSSRWFRETYPLTPATSIAARGDFTKRDRGSAWYNSRYYRANLYWDATGMRIRDLHLFDETYAERYLRDICSSSAAFYDTLPLCEGFLWSGEETRSGFRVEGTAPLADQPRLAETGAGELSVTWETPSGRVAIHFSEKRLRLDLPKDAFLVCQWAEGKEVPFLEMQDGFLRCRHQGHEYGLRCATGRLALDLTNRALAIDPEAGVIELTLG